MDQPGPSKPKNEPQRQCSAVARRAKFSELLFQLSQFSSSITDRNLITEAINSISSVVMLLEDRGCPEFFGVTKVEYDLLLLMKAVALCCRKNWEEAEDILFRLTEEYHNAVFYSLLGIVKNKLRRYKCSRDALFLALLAPNSPDSFSKENITLSGLKQLEMKDCIKDLMVFAESMEEIPMNNHIIGKEITVAVNVPIGKIIREEIYPIIRLQIDEILCTTILNKDEVESFAVDDIAVDMSRVFASIKNKIPIDDEIALLKEALEEVDFNYVDYMTYIYSLELNLSVARKHVSLLQQGEQRLRQQNKELKTTINNVLKLVFSEYYRLQKMFYDESKTKYILMEALVKSICPHLEKLGLKNDLNTVASSVMKVQREIAKAERKNDVNLSKVFDFINDCKYAELGEIGFRLEISPEQSLALLDLVEKLIGFCRVDKTNNDLTAFRQLSVDDRLEIQAQSSIPEEYLTFLTQIRILNLDDAEHQIKGPTTAFNREDTVRDMTTEDIVEHLRSDVDPCPNRQPLPVYPIGYGYGFPLCGFTPTPPRYNPPSYTSSTLNISASYANLVSNAVAPANLSTPFIYSNAVTSYTLFKPNFPPVPGVSTPSFALSSRSSQMFQFPIIQNPPPLGNERAMSSNSLKKCKLCYDYLFGEKMCDLHCGHEFHQSCLELWLTTANVCPTCKKGIHP